MGEKQNQPFQLLFNASLKVDFQGSRVTFDGGLILVRELDERLGLEKAYRGTPERLAKSLSGGKFVVSRAGKAYYVPVGGPNRKFRLKEVSSFVSSEEPGDKLFQTQSLIQLANQNQAAIESHSRS
ncbi:MAG TPA: hypothetical protein VF753_06220, partial [Terriglobales bacterium]